MVYIDILCVCLTPILIHAGISVGSTTAYCKLGNGTVRNLCQDTVYTHPTSKVCNYTYTHPATKQCAWEPTYQGLKIINQYTITSTQTVNLTSAKMVTFGPGKGPWGICSGEVRIRTSSGTDMRYMRKRIDVTQDNIETDTSIVVPLFTPLQSSSPSGIITFDRMGMFANAFSPNCIVYINGYGDPSQFTMEVQYMEQFFVTIYG